MSRCKSGFVLAYNLGNFLRRLAMRRPVKHWSLTPTYVGTMGEARQDWGEGGHARPVRHLPDLPAGRQVAEVALPKRLFRAILERIRRLRLPDTVPRGLQRGAKQPEDAEATGRVCADRH